MTDPSIISRLYGRSKGKPLRTHQQHLVDTLLPQIAVPQEGKVTSRALFGDDRPLHFEIGFGGGEHMATRADLLPDHGFIGCEPFLNGVGQALAHFSGDAQKPGIPNVRIHHGDALDVLRRIPDGTLAMAYLLHPDPWPKARHIKRRMMNDGPIDMIAAKLKSGGEFRFGTDHPIYVAHTMMVMRRHRHQFEWLADSSESFLARPSGWPETRYEAKARRLGHEVWYFRYHRK